MGVQSEAHVLSVPKILPAPLHYKVYKEITKRYFVTLWLVWGKRKTVQLQVTQSHRMFSPPPFQWQSARPPSDETHKCVAGHVFEHESGHLSFECNSQSHVQHVLLYVSLTLVTANRYHTTYAYTVYTHVYIIVDDTILVVNFITHNCTEKIPFQFIKRCLCHTPCSRTGQSRFKGIEYHTCTYTHTQPSEEKTFRKKKVFFQY